MVGWEKTWIHKKKLVFVDNLKLACKMVTQGAFITIDEADLQLIKKAEASSAFIHLLPRKTKVFALTAIASKLRNDVDHSIFSSYGFV